MLFIKYFAQLATWKVSERDSEMKLRLRCLKARKSTQSEAAELCSVDLTSILLTLKTKEKKNLKFFESI